MRSFPYKIDGRDDIFRDIAAIPEATGVSASQVRIGQLFTDAKPPHHQWRVVERRGSNYVLERRDKPNVRRFPDVSALLDPDRYRKGGS